MSRARAAAKKPPALRHAHAEIPCHNGALRLVVVADTHSLPHRDAARHIAAEKPDAILHAGDIGDLAVLDGLSAIAPLTAIRGNIDVTRGCAPRTRGVHAPELPDTISVDVLDEGRPLLRLLLVHIAVYGPKLRADAAKLAHAEGARVVVCGHSHVPFIGRDKGLTVFNPGSIGPRRFALPIVFGVMEIDRRRVRMHHVDCETGSRWEP